MKQITGTVYEVRTMRDQSVRLVIEVDQDAVPGDVIKWQYQEVVLRLTGTDEAYEDIDEEDVDE